MSELVLSLRNISGVRQEGSNSVNFQLYSLANSLLGGLAQVVERPLSMREVPGSIPGFSNRSLFIFLNTNFNFQIVILPFSLNSLIEEENAVRRTTF